MFGYAIRGHGQSSEKLRALTGRRPRASHAGQVDATVQQLRGHQRRGDRREWQELAGRGAQAERRAPCRACARERPGLRRARGSGRARASKQGALRAHRRSPAPESDASVWPAPFTLPIWATGAAALTWARRCSSAAGRARCTRHARAWTDAGAGLRAMIMEAVKANVAATLLAQSTAASTACAPARRAPGSSDGAAIAPAAGAASHRPRRQVASVPQRRAAAGYLWARRPPRVTAPRARRWRDGVSAANRSRAPAARQRPCRRPSWPSWPSTGREGSCGRAAPERGDGQRDAADGQGHRQLGRRQAQAAERARRGREQRRELRARSARVTPASRPRQRRKQSAGAAGRARLVDEVEQHREQRVAAQRQQHLPLRIPRPLAPAGAAADRQQRVALAVRRAGRRAPGLAGTRRLGLELGSARRRARWPGRRAMQAGGRVLVRERPQRSALAARGRASGLVARRRKSAGGRARAGRRARARGAGPAIPVRRRPAALRGYATAAARLAGLTARQQLGLDRRQLHACAPPAQPVQLGARRGPVRRPRGAG